MHFPSRSARLAALALVLSLSGSALADVADQASGCESNGAGNLALQQPLGQTFKPSQSQLDAVEFRLVGFATGSATITVTVRENDFAGSVVGSASAVISLTNNVLAYYRVEFAPPLTVIPEATYMLALSVNNTSVGIPATYCPQYTRGQAWANGVASLSDVDFSFRTYGPCGNGMIDGGEDCDDGSFSGGCCDFPTCQYVAAGEVCPSASLCVNSQCDGAGQCLTTTEPLSTCTSATKASLSIKSSATPGKSKVKFKWSKGTLDDADLGMSIIAVDYALCVYDADGHVVSNVLPANGSWVADYPKLYYKDKTGAMNGITAIALKRSDELLKANVSASLGGATFPAPLSMALTPPVTAQVRNSAGGCWGASFDSTEVTKNDGTSVKAKEKNLLP